MAGWVDIDPRGSPWRYRDVLAQRRSQKERTVTFESSDHALENSIEQNQNNEVPVAAPQASRPPGGVTRHHGDERDGQTENLSKNQNENRTDSPKSGRNDSPRSGSAGSPRSGRSSAGGQQNGEGECVCEWQDECQLGVIVEACSSAMLHASCTAGSLRDMLLAVCRSTWCYIMKIVRLLLFIFNVIFGNIAALKDSLLSLEPGSIGFYCAWFAALTALLSLGASAGGQAVCVYPLKCYYEWLCGSPPSAQCSSVKGFDISEIFTCRKLPKSDCGGSYF